MAEINRRGFLSIASKMTGLAAIAATAPGCGLLPYGGPDNQNNVKFITDDQLQSVLLGIKYDSNPADLSQYKNGRVVIRSTDTQCGPAVYENDVRYDLLFTDKDDVEFMLSVHDGCEGQGSGRRYYDGEADTFTSSEMKFSYEGGLQVASVETYLKGGVRTSATVRDLQTSAQTFYRMIHEIVKDDLPFIWNPQFNFETPK
jgi:hypothetical protein